MTPAGFERAVPASGRPQIVALRLHGLWITEISLMYVVKSDQTAAGVWFGWLVS
jgi:hypothetical protein